VYPSLKALEKARLVRTWTVIPGRARGGRSRRYYELTVLGVRQAEREGEALAEIALARRSAPPLSPAEHEAMRERIERVCELHAFAIEARSGLGRTRRHP
jgi:DNA-binding PadR family transcriptional regulator